MAAPTWYPSAAQYVRLNGGEANVALAAAFGTSEATIRRARSENRGPRTAQAPTSGAQVDGPTELELAQDEVRQLRARARKNGKVSVGEERTLRAIEAAAAAAMAPLEFAAVLAPTPVGGAHHRQAAIWSDWHYGETVDAAQMNGINAFDVQIAEERVDKLVAAMLSFKAARPELTGLDIWILGDMASGAIHGLEETNEIPAAAQFVAVGRLMAKAISQLAPHYTNIHCTTTFGNHPRPNPEPASKGAYNNGDWIAYHMAAALTSSIPNVTWEIPTAGMVVREIAGLSVLLWHGDGVRSSMPGVPWGGVMRRWNTLKSTYAERGIYLDYVALGHFHQACVVPGIFMNASLIGQNEYGLKNFGGGQGAMQLLLTFDEKHRRLTDVSYIDLA